MEQYTALKDEVQLLGYGESDTSGPWIKLRLLDPDQLTPFRGEKKGKRYAAVLVEIGDDEQPVEPELKGGPLSQRLALLNESAAFRVFVMRHVNHRLKDYTKVSTDEIVKELYGFKSKRELDHNQLLGSEVNRFMLAYEAESSGCV